MDIMIWFRSTTIYLAIPGIDLTYHSFFIHHGCSPSIQSNDFSLVIQHYQKWDTYRTPVWQNSIKQNQENYNTYSISQILLNITLSTESFCWLKKIKLNHQNIDQRIKGSSSYHICPIKHSCPNEHPQNLSQST